jgi:hypothetical protein
MYGSYISTLWFFSSVDVGFVRPFLMNLLALHFRAPRSRFSLPMVWIILLLCLMKQKEAFSYSILLCLCCCRTVGVSRGIPPRIRLLSKSMLLVCLGLVLVAV